MAHPDHCKARCEVCSGWIYFYNLAMEPRPAPKGSVRCMTCKHKAVPS